MVNIFFIFISLFLCGKQETKDLVCIKITQVYPLLNKNGSVSGYDTLVTKIYYKKNQVVLHSSFRFETYNGPNLKKTISEIRWHDLVYTKGNKFALLYDKEHGERIVPTDSVLKKEWVYRFDIYGIFKKYNCTLVSSTENYNHHNFKESYEFIDKTDSAIAGTMRLWFSRNLKTEYSLSQELDSLKNSKLYKIKIFNNAAFMKHYGINIDQSIQEWNLEIIPVKNSNQILKYFEADKLKNN